MAEGGVSVSAPISFNCLNHMWGLTYNNLKEMLHIYNICYHVMVYQARYNATKPLCYLAVGPASHCEENILERLFPSLAHV